MPRLKSTFFSPFLSMESIDNQDVSIHLESRLMLPCPNPRILSATASRTSTPAFLSSSDASWLARQANQRCEGVGTASRSGGSRVAKHDMCDAFNLSWPSKTTFCEFDWLSSTFHVRPQTYAGKRHRREEV
jgi:hypothetical protein